MNLNAVRMFVSIVQTGSFSRSSEQLNVPIATLSRNISELEKTLRTQLLIRNKSGASTTTAGQRFYEQSLDAIEQLLSAECSLSENEQILKGRLRITTPPFFLPAWEVIAEFSRAYPKVSVHCVASDRLMDFFADGIDVAFRMDNLHTDAVIAKKLMTTHMALVTTPAFLAEFGTPSTLKDLGSYPLAMWHNIGKIRTNSLFVDERPEFSFRFTSNDLNAILYYVRRDLAIGVLPPYMVKDLIQTGELVEILADEAKISHDVHMIYPAHRHQSAILKTFVEFCVGYFHSTSPIQPTSPATTAAGSRVV